MYYGYIMLYRHIKPHVYPSNPKPMCEIAICTQLDVSESQYMLPYHAVTWRVAWFVGVFEILEPIDIKQMLCECFTDHTLVHPLNCRGGVVARLSA